VLEVSPLRSHPYLVKIDKNNKLVRRCENTFTKQDENIENEEESSDKLVMLKSNREN